MLTTAEAGPIVTVHYVSLAEVIGVTVEPKDWDTTYIALVSGRIVQVGAWPPAAFDPCWTDIWVPPAVARAVSAHRPKD